MADDPNPKPPVEVIPSVQGGISAIGSAHAPFLYFEDASAFGVLNPAANALKAAIDGALLLAAPGPTQTKN